MLAYRRPECAEASLKYLVLGGTATATLLMGVSLLYGSSGFARDLRVRRRIALARCDGRAVAVVRLRHRVLPQWRRIVPFHAWAPDAYESSGWFR
jgi:NADH-quinone oxidoreductase subunit N